MSLDLALLRLLRTRGHPPALEAVVARATVVGEHGLLWHALAAAGALLDRRRRPLYLRATRVTLAAYAVNQAVKFTVRRRRPRLDGLPPLASTFSDLSFPSAHASTSFAAARVLGHPGVYLVALAMALSRPYLGLHYPSDTLAGAILGDATGRLTP